MDIYKSRNPSITPMTESEPRICYQNFKSLSQLSESGFYYLAPRYSEDFFENSNLILFAIFSSTSAEEIVVDSLNLNNGVLTLSVTAVRPEIALAVMVYWEISLVYDKPIDPIEFTITLDKKTLSDEEYAKWVAQKAE